MKLKKLFIFITFLFFGFLFCDPPNFDSPCNPNNKIFQRFVILRNITRDSTSYCNTSFYKSPNASASTPQINFTLTSSQVPFSTAPLMPSGVTNLPLLENMVWTPSIDTTTQSFTTTVKYRVKAVRFQFTFPIAPTSAKLNGTSFSPSSTIDSPNLVVGANILNFEFVISGNTFNRTFTINRSPQFLYVTNGNNSPASRVNGFVLNESTNTLSPTPNSPHILGGEIGSLDIEATGNYLIVTHGVGGLPSTQFSIWKINSTTGELTQINGSPFTASGNNTDLVIVDKIGKFFYLVQGLNLQKIGFDSATETVTLGGVFPSGVGASNSIRDVAISPDNKSLVLVCSFGTSPKVVSMAINPTNGDLSNQQNITTFDGVNNNNIAIHPAGDKLLLFNSSAPNYYLSRNVSTMVIGASNSTTASFGGVFEYGLVFSRDGLFAYIGEETTRVLYSFSVNQTSGDITILNNLTLPSVSNIHSLDIDFTNRYIAVSRGTSSDLNLVGVLSNGQVGSLYATYPLPFPSKQLRAVKFAY